MAKKTKRAAKRQRDPGIGLALEIYDRLEKLHKLLIRRRGKKPSPLTLDLTIETELNGRSRRKFSRRFASSLLESLEDRIAEELSATEPFLPGSVYCYWCNSPRCEHARPTTPRTVFAGYDATGIPLWSDLASVCLEHQHPKVEYLHRDPPRPLTLFMPGKSLIRKQLPVFGKKSRVFRVLCQALVGYLPFTVEGSTQKTALTIQAVETKQGGDKSKLHLNLVGITSSGEDLCKVLEEAPDQRLSESFEKANQEISHLAIQRPGKQRTKQLVSVIKRTASGVERFYRQKARRTKHASYRQQDPSRPTAAALPDTRNAKHQDFFLDRRRNTYVVLGPHCRVHLFNHAGKLVTSFIFRGEDLEKRIQTRQWIPLESEEVAKLKKAVLSG